MAAAKKYSVEQIVAKLREHEKLQGQGLTIPQACKCPAPRKLVHWVWPPNLDRPE